MADMNSAQYFIERFSVTCDKPVSHVQLACCSSHCAVPWGDKNIRVYTTNNFEVICDVVSNFTIEMTLVFYELISKTLLFYCLL